MNEWNVSIYLVSPDGAHELVNHQCINNAVQVSGNYYILIFLLAIHMGIAVSFLVGYRTSFMTVGDICCPKP